MQFLKIILSALFVIMLNWDTVFSQRTHTLSASAKVLENIVVGSSSQLLNIGRLQAGEAKHIYADQPDVIGREGGNSDITISGNEQRGFVEINFVDGEEFAVEITAPNELTHSVDASTIKFSLEDNRSGSTGQLNGLITQSDVPNNPDGNFSGINGGTGSDFTSDVSNTDQTIWRTGDSPGNGVLMPGSTVYLVLGGGVDDIQSATNSYATLGTYSGTIQITATIIN